jgi:ABC-type polar amino acid transport system ATPase subunit
MLEINNLSKKYKKHIVLDEISLQVPPKHIALILGSSGAGKSTLLRIVAGLETADSGSIILDGKVLPTTTLNARERSYKVGMVFQNFNLFEHMTVLENITFPLIYGAGMNRAQAITRAEELLAHYQLSEKKNVSASQLSGGQKQRLAIARSVALSPRVICLDEPTSALDPLLTSHVAKTIQELAHEGYSVLVSSHDTRLIKNLMCTLYLLDKGKLIETATSLAFNHNPGNYPHLRKFIEGAH